MREVKGKGNKIEAFNNNKKMKEKRCIWFGRELALRVEYIVTGVEGGTTY